MGGAARQTTRERNRRGEGERLRAEILTATERLLATQPVEALSLRAVAREVGVTAPALYLHFADRRALVWAVLEHQFGVLTAVVTDAAERASDPRGRLREWCLAYCRYGLDHPGHYRVLFESWTAQRVDLPLADLPGHALWQSLLDALAACGVPPDESKEVGTLVWAGLHGLVSLRVNKPSFPWPPLDQLVDGHLRRMLFEVADVDRAAGSPPVR
jgi:AcrR family transcriptional regulator